MAVIKFALHTILWQYYSNAGIFFRLYVFGVCTLFMMPKLANGIYVDRVEIRLQFIDANVN